MRWSRRPKSACRDARGNPVPATSRPSRRTRNSRHGAPTSGRYPATNLNRGLAGPGHGTSVDGCSGIRTATQPRSHDHCAVRSMRCAADEVALRKQGGAVSAARRKVTGRATVARLGRPTGAFPVAMALAVRRRLSAGNRSETGAPGAGVTVGRSDLRSRHVEVGLGNISNAKSTKARTFGVR